jgi:hypothetical protein
MSINKIHKILLLVSTVGISAGGSSDILPSAHSQSSAAIPSTTEEPRTEGFMQDCLAGLMQDCLAGLTKTKNKLGLSTLGLFTRGSSHILPSTKPTTEEYMRVYLDELTQSEKVCLVYKALHELLGKDLLTGYLHQQDWVRLETALPRIECDISIKSLEFDAIPLKLTLTGGASNLYTKIRAELGKIMDGDLSDLSLLVYYPKKGSNQLIRHVYQFDSSSMPDTFILSNDVVKNNIKEMQFYLDFSKIAVKKIATATLFKALLRPEKLPPTTSVHYSRVIKTSCISLVENPCCNYATEAIINSQSSTDTLSYSVFCKSLEKRWPIIKIPTKIIGNIDSRFSEEQLNQNGARIFEALQEARKASKSFLFGKSIKLLFDRHNKLLLLRDESDEPAIYSLVLSVGHGKLGPNEDDKYSYVIIPISSGTNHYYSHQKVPENAYIVEIPTKTKRAAASSDAVNELRSSTGTT